MQQPHTTKRFKLTRATGRRGSKKGCRGASKSGKLRAIKSGKLVSGRGKALEWGGFGGKVVSLRRRIGLCGDAT
jgi:hypothetical protein